MGTELAERDNTLAQVAYAETIDFRLCEVGYGT